MKRYMLMLAIFLLLLSGCERADASEDLGGKGGPERLLAAVGEQREFSGNRESVKRIKMEEAEGYRDKDDGETVPEAEGETWSDRRTVFEAAGETWADGETVPEAAEKTWADGETAPEAAGETWADGGTAPGVKAESRDLAAHECSWDDGVLLRQSGCDSDGTILFTCTVCGAQKEENAAPSGHCYESELLILCEAQPVIRRYCILCGRVESEEIVDEEAISHSWEEKTAFGYAEPDCISGAQCYEKCARCGMTTDSFWVESLGHTHGPEPERVEDSGCQAFTQAVYRCIRCGEEMYEDTAQYGAHQWEEVILSPWNPEKQDWDTVTEVRCRICTVRRE